MNEAALASSSTKAVEQAKGRPGSGFGWLASFGLATTLLFGANLVATRIETSWVRWLFCTVAFSALVTIRPLRRALIKALVLAIVLAVAVYAIRNRDAIRNGRIGRSEAAREILRGVAALGPGKQLRILFQQRTGAREAIGYDQYLRAVDSRSREINDLASTITRGCADGDHLCESARIVRFVTDDIEYRTDPRGGPDYVKPPTQTYESRAGDCEDKTVLLVSLLETIGIRTLMAFPPQHAYPMVCYEQPLPMMLVESVRIAERQGVDRRPYFEAMSPSGNRSAMITALTSARYVRDRGRYCYAVETTQRGSWIGTAHESLTVERVFDPIDRRVVTLAQ